FSMKSAAPRRVAATALWILPWPEIMITRTSGRSVLIRRRSSMPSIPGIQISSRTSAGCSRAISSITPAGSPVSSTRKPSSPRMPRSEDRIRSSSSTTNTVSFTLFSCLEGMRRAKCALAENVRELLVFYRKFEHESTSPRRPLAHPHEAVMVGDDSGGNRQAQAGATLTGRKIGLEDTRAHRRRNSGSVVTNFQGDHSAERVEGRAELHPRPFAAVGVGRARGVHRVLHQIDQRALER